MNKTREGGALAPTQPRREFAWRDVSAAIAWKYVAVRVTVGGVCRLPAPGRVGQGLATKEAVELREPFQSHY